MIKLFPSQPTTDVPADDTTAESKAAADGTADDGEQRSVDGFDIAAAIASEDRTGNGDRPWLYTNMVASADGGTAVDGKSGQLGGPADRAVFAGLRAVADVILVGASTVREERYRPPIQSAETVARRLEQGHPAHPRLAVVTRSLGLEDDLPLFDDPDHRPYIVTVDDAPSDRRDRLSERADILTAGASGVDLTTALKLLGSLGAKTVLSEGGPSLNGQLIGADLIDEWNLTLSPRLLGADSKRAAVGPLGAGPPRAMSLQRVWTEDHLLFCRWTRS